MSPLASLHPALRRSTPCILHNATFEADRLNEVIFLGIMLLYYMKVLESYSTELPSCRRDNLKPHS